MGVQSRTRLSDFQFIQFNQLLRPEHSGRVSCTLRIKNNALGLGAVCYQWKSNWWANEKERDTGVGDKTERGASQMVQGLRFCLAMQEMSVRCLTQEDPSCHGTTGPMSHNLLSLHFGAHESQLLSPCPATAEACASRAQALQ